jgi:hypothetical protein
MRIIYVLAEIKGEEWPFAVTAQADDNFGENWKEDEVMWLYSFKTEEDAMLFIRDMQNAPILRQIVSEDGKLLVDEYVRYDTLLENTIKPDLDEEKRYRRGDISTN